MSQEQAAMNPIGIGLNINHDTLSSLNDQHRNLAITYFIAMNTPWKLDPSDRLLANVEGNRIKNSTRQSAILGAVGAGLAASTCKKLKLLWVPFSVITTYFVLNNVFRESQEKHFVFKSTLNQNWTKKYNFTVFDFHNSKREALLFNLSRKIRMEGNHILNETSTA